MARQCVLAVCILACLTTCCTTTACSLTSFPEYGIYGQTSTTNSDKIVLSSATGAIELS